MKIYKFCPQFTFVLQILLLLLLRKVQGPALLTVTSQGFGQKAEWRWYLKCTLNIYQDIIQNRNSPDSLYAACLPPSNSVVHFVSMISEGRREGDPQHKL